MVARDWVEEGMWSDYEWAQGPMNGHRVPRHFGTRQKGGLHSTGKRQNTADGAPFKMVNLMLVNFTLINNKESTATRTRPTT